MKLLTLICLITSLTHAATNFIDFAQLDGNDIDGLAYVCDNWLDYDPNAIDSNSAVITHTLSSLDLTGSFCNQYTITAKPDNGELYDLYNGKYYPVRRIPYRIKKGGSSLYYYSESDANDSFSFKTFNTNDGRESPAATFVITKTNYTANSLYFERTGVIIIPDNNAVEFDESFSFCFWLWPKARYGSILKKRSSSGPGIEISIRSKHLVVEAWNTSGEYGKVIFPTELWDYWISVSITLDNADPNKNNMYIEGFGDCHLTDLPAPPYSNDEDIILCSRSVGLIDKPTWFEAKDEFSIVFYLSEGRTVYGGLFAPTDYLAQFRIDEGIGSTITDYVSGTLTGSLTNILWQPNGRPKNNKYNFN